MIRLDGGVIRLEEHCPVEEAEPLLELLQGDGSRTLDLSGCRSVHTAVLQLLLVCRTRIVAAPPAPALAGILSTGTLAADSAGWILCGSGA